MLPLLLQCYNHEKLRAQCNIPLPLHMAGKKTFPLGIELWDLEPRHVEPLPSTAEPDTKDVECEIFETRSNFLSLCQGNHFQFDSLRRAKHSTMMVLYHLHNPDEPAFASNCNGCSKDIEPGRGWRCTVCSDYDLCEICYKRVNRHGIGGSSCTAFALASPCPSPCVPLSDWNPSNCWICWLALFLPSLPANLADLPSFCRPCQQERPAPAPDGSRP